MRFATIALSTLALALCVTAYPGYYTGAGCDDPTGLTGEVISYWVGSAGEGCPGTEDKQNCFPQAWEGGSECLCWSGAAGANSAKILGTTTIKGSTMYQIEQYAGAYGCDAATATNVKTKSFPVGNPGTCIHETLNPTTGGVYGRYINYQDTCL